MRRNELVGIAAKNAALAGLAIVLWSPVVGLTPFDPNILKAAAAVTSYVAIPAAAVMVNRPLLSADKTRFIDDAASGGEDPLLDELDRLARHRGVVSEIAREAARQIRTARGKKDSYLLMLGSTKLAVGSIAWSRYASIVDKMYMTVRSNSKNVLANLQAFDFEDYSRLVKLLESGEYHGDGVDDMVQEERHHLYVERLSRMRSVLSQSERLLLEFDKLIAEIASSDMAVKDDAAEGLLESMRVLVDESRQYD